MEENQEAKSMFCWNPIFFIGIFGHHINLFSQDNEKIGIKLLIEDIRQLVKTIEESHPDPYINGGGKIAFHRRFQQMLRSVSEQGMTKFEFIDLITPFVAKIGYSHTALHSFGAKIIGTPSAQPGNIFGDTLVFTLTNLKVNVS